MKRSLIVAHGKNREIGINNSLPWAGDLPADMKHFRDITVGNSVVMGRLTYESILDVLGKPLPERENIVLTRDKNFDTPFEGVRVCNDIEEALAVESIGDELIVIGGATIYKLALPHLDTMHITKIEQEFPEADSFFVDVNYDNWRVTDRKQHFADENDSYDYTFLTYQRVDDDE